MRPLILMVAAACATAGARSQYGAVNMKDIWGPGAPPEVVQVGPDRVVGSNFELREENGCVRGYYGNRPVSFCRDDKGASPEQHWSGPTGDIYVKPQGSLYQVSGNMLSGGAPVPVNDAIPLNASNGKGWHELVRHPALLAVLTELPALR